MSNAKIVRIAPGNQRIQIEWQLADASLEITPVLQWKRRSERWDEAEEVDLPGSTDPKARQHTMEGLSNGIDYEFRILLIRGTDRAVVGESPVRLARPGFVPGTVVNYHHPEDLTFDSSGRSTASPSIAVLPNGRYVASHDMYWREGGQHLSFIFYSDDRGVSWHYLSELDPCFWGKLFVHRGHLYMLSTSTEYGALLIRRSEDGGETWSAPTEIIPAGSREKGGPHKAPVPVVEYEGRLWSAVEHGSWKLGAHDAGVVSVPVDADLLDPRSWTVTPFLKYDPSWPGAVSGTGPSVLEGNIVVAPDGELVNFLRYQTNKGKPDYGRAVMLKVDRRNPAASPTFGRIVDFHGNMSKFTIAFDPVTRHYFSLVNRVTTDNPGQRNILTLVSSPDLIRWNIVIDILNYQDNGWHEDMRLVGFQYVDWLFDGDDIIALSRTAINGANNFHDANHITFHRIEKFRTIFRRTFGE